MDHDRELLLEVANKHPDLTASGFQNRTSPDYERSRADLLSDVEGFAAACEFLEACGKGTGIAPYSSYAIKHVAEGLFQTRGREVYVANGVFIAAALARNFKVVKILGAPNAYLGVSTAGLRKTDRAAREHRRKVPE